MRKKFITFITGTSGAGKSTLVENLKKMNLTSVDIHDFDEGGVPQGADENWRKQRTNHWVNIAKENFNNGISTIICGVCVPNEIKSCENYSDSLNIPYGFIDISESEISKRLLERNWNEGSILDNINWSKHLKNFVLQENNHFIVDGQNNSPYKVAKLVIQQLSYS